MSATSEQDVFYADFKLTSGLVETNPTWTIEPSAFAKTSQLPTREKIEIDKKNQEAQIGKALSMAAKLRLSIPSTHKKSVGKRFRESYIPNPGLSKIDDDYYTGWGYVTQFPGAVTLLHRSPNREETDIDRRPLVPSPPPYYVMDSALALAWHDRMAEGRRHPLTTAELERLSALPHQANHPLYAETRAKSGIEQTRMLADFMADFTSDWNLASGGKNREAAQAEIARKYIVPMSVFDKVSRDLYKRLTSDAVKRMTGLGVTVFNLENGCLVAYRNSQGQIEYRCLQIPPNVRGHFQRYIALGQKPLTAKEMQANYLAYVDLSGSKTF